MIVAAILFMGGLGFSLAVVLAAASRIFHVDEDPRLQVVKAALPGLNCGACGYAGCAGAAKALLDGRASMVICVVGGLEVIEALTRVTGRQASIADRPTAVVHCFGPERLPTRFDYRGPRDCRAVSLLYGGWPGCTDGCLGGGTCAAVCPFEAIRMDRQRRPQIDPFRCRGCGRCVTACPRGLIRLETLSDRLLHLDRTTDCLAPCRQKCPAQIDIPRFIGHLIRGEKATALQIIKLRNPFPAVVGRTCPHACETICRRNIADEGIAVGHLARYLGEWERRSGRRVALHCLPDTGRRVAVVGGGPAGLACAYFLRRLGHRPTIFEARDQLGGMLRFGIPAYRLPREVVEWEIGGILELGMTVRTRTALGREVSLGDLRREGFEAIFLGLGAWTVPPLGIPGEDAAGVWASLDFLAAAGSRLTHLQGQRVVVIGESNTAMDCARSSIRLDAAAVSVICPRDRRDASARKRDVLRAEAEGVHIRFMARPLRLTVDVAGRVRGVVCQELMPDADRSDAAAPYRPVAGSEAELAADLVIVAYDRRPDLSRILVGDDAGLGLATTRTATLAADDVTQLAAAPDLFAAGDLHTGRATVIGAVGGGRRAARSIHRLLTGDGTAAPGDLRCRIDPRSILKAVHPPPGPPRVTLEELPVDRRRRSFVEEVVATISADAARAEARRCLQCGRLCYAGRRDESFSSGGFPGVLQPGKKSDTAPSRRRPPRLAVNLPNQP